MELHVKTIGSIAEPGLCSALPCPGGYTAVASPNELVFFPSLPLVAPVRTPGRLSLVDVAGDVLYVVPVEAHPDAVVSTTSLSRPGVPRPLSVGADAGDNVAVLAAVPGLRAPDSAAESAFVVSCTRKGVVSFFYSRGPLRGVAVFRNVCRLGVGSVLSADSSTPGYVAFAALLGKRLGIHIVKVSVLDDASAGSAGSGDLDVEVFDVVWAPTCRKGGSTVTGVLIQPHAAFVSYSSGELHMFSPRYGYRSNEHGGTLEAWRTSTDSVLDPDEGEECGELGEVGTAEEGDARSSMVVDVEASPVTELSMEDIDREAVIGDSVLDITLTPSSVSKKLEDKAKAERRRSSTTRSRQKLAANRPYVYQPRVAVTLKSAAVEGPSPGQTDAGKDSSSGSHGETRNSTGGIAALNVSGCVVVAYGRTVSVWDGEYGTGHGFVELPSDVLHVVHGPSDRQVTLISASGAVYCMSLDAARRRTSVTLADALKNHAACSSIVSSHFVTPVVSRAPLTSHPVAVSVLKATADSGVSSRQFLNPHFKVEDREEHKRLQKVIAPSETPSALHVSEAVDLYVFGNSSSAGSGRGAKSLRRSGVTSRHPKGQGAAQLGLSRLPSQRLAANVVARCVWELLGGSVEFAAPLIDIISTGCVCAGLVPTALVSLRESCAPRRDGDMEAVPLALASALGRTMETSFALEAVLMRVADVSEGDVVRALQHGTRSRLRASVVLGHRGVAGAIKFRDDCVAGMEKEERIRRRRVSKLERLIAAGVRDEKCLRAEQELKDIKLNAGPNLRKRLQKVEDAKNHVHSCEAAEKQLARANRLIARSLATPVDNSSLSAAIRRMPAHDVVAFLEYCLVIMIDFNVAAATARVVAPSERRTAKPAAFKKAAKEGGWKQTDGRSLNNVDSANQSEARPARSLNSGEENSVTSPSEYVGRGRWVDEQLFPGADLNEGGLRFQTLCAEWVGRMVEGHMATLVMDDTGAKLVRELLVSVRMHRKRAVLLSSLQGMVSHVQEGLPLPKCLDTLYAKAEDRVSKSAGLL